MSVVRFEKQGRVGIVTIDNPATLNALSVSVLRELEGIVDALAADGETHCVVVTGAGPKAFVAGADIAEMRELDEPRAQSFSAYGNSVFMKLELLPMPVIAAVNGYALGGGCELALACDTRIAARKAVFSFPETSLGIIPGFGGTQRLARAVGYPKALRMIATAERINAEKALSIGLVDELVEDDALLARALEMANGIGENAPLAVRAAKKAIRSGQGAPIEDGILAEQRIFGSIFATRDSKEGLGAFVEKRKKNFTNS